VHCARTKKIGKPFFSLCSNFLLAAFCIHLLVIGSTIVETVGYNEICTAVEGSHKLSVDLDRETNFDTLLEAFAV
jgi:hypothetical protein